MNGVWMKKVFRNLEGIQLKIENYSQDLEHWAKWLITDYCRINKHFLRSHTEQKMVLSSGGCRLWGAKVYVQRGVRLQEKEKRAILLRRAPWLPWEKLSMLVLPAPFIAAAFRGSRKKGEFRIRGCSIYSTKLHVWDNY